jgi:hypothetical protein
MSFDPINIKITKDKGKLFIFHNGWPYDLAVNPFLELNFSPTTQAVDKFINYCAEMKGIKNDLLLEIRSDWFFFYDAFLEFDYCFLDGWLYKIKSEKTKIIYTHVWICPHMKLFFNSTPKELYVKIDQFEG